MPDADEFLFDDSLEGAKQAGVMLEKFSSPFYLIRNLRVCFAAVI